MAALVVDLLPDDARLAQAWAVLGELRTHLDAARMDEVYAHSCAQGYQVTGLFTAEECVAVAGWRIGMNMHLGRNLYVEDLVTAELHRDKGYGGVLLRHLAELARTEGCAVVHLDSGVQRHDAHRFYFREGMRISSHHFLKEL
jgi:GNAT superfamily N-acetyltransferase